MITKAPDQPVKVELEPSEEEESGSSHISLLMEPWVRKKAHRDRAERNLVSYRINNNWSPIESITKYLAHIFNFDQQWFQCYTGDTIQH